MEPPFKKKILKDLSDQAFSLRRQARMIAVGPLKRIRRGGPFMQSGIDHEYSFFSQLLVEIIRALPELPDFSDDSRIAVMSDYGGEHRDAAYETYSFLFVALDKIALFQAEMGSLRQQYGIHDKYSEFKYKDLKYGPRSRALPSYLELVDKTIHGALVTVAIDKEIGTVFGISKKEAHATIREVLEGGGFGKWKGAVAEKLLRVQHILTAFAGAMTHDGQRLFWYSDADQINEDGKDRTFAHTQQLFGRIAPIYMQHGLEVLAFGKSFPEKGYLDDLLSVPDFAAGMLQDLLTAQEKRVDFADSEEKQLLQKWMASPSDYLSKINVCISPTAEGYHGRMLTIDLK